MFHVTCPRVHLIFLDIHQSIYSYAYPGNQSPIDTRRQILCKVLKLLQYHSYNYYLTYVVLKLAHFRSVLFCQSLCVSPNNIFSG